MSSSDDNSQPARIRQAPAGAESARRVLDLLLSFSEHRHTQTAKELAARTGVPLPTVYRHVALLRDMGLILERGAGRYSLSGRVLGLARAAEAAETLIDYAHPVMQRLSDELAETVILVRLIAGAAVCVHRIEASRSLRTSYEPGQPLPLQRGASGRLLLASLPPAARARALARHLDPDHVADFAAEVDRAAERGWATSSEEIDTGIWAAAAAVRERGRIVAALSVPSPIVRVPPERRDERIASVRSAAAEISAALDAASTGASAATAAG